MLLGVSVKWQLLFLCFYAPVNAAKGVSICMYKHATVDGQSRHMFTCERKEICEGLTIGFGKRSTSDNHTQHDMAKDRMERRVNIDCCDSDYCNSPFGTTTTSTTQVTSTTTTTATTTTATTTTTTTTPKPKPTTASTRQTKHTTTTAKPTGSAVCFKDIVFVLDDSRSVGSNNFAHELDFVTRIVSQIHVGVQNAHVSVMTYDSHPQIQWYLNKYTNQRDVINAIHRVHYSGGHTYVNSALDAVRTNILNKNHGDRSSAANAVVVLTDGGTNSGQQSLTSHAHSLHAVTKDVVSIGIGQDVDLHGLNTIATDRSHMFVIHDFNHLHSILQNVINIICS